jgi:hypothetical protein
LLKRFAMRIVSIAEANASIENFGTSKKPMV